MTEGTPNPTRLFGRRHLTTFAVAELLEVDPGSVANWVDESILKAYRTPGGHRRVAVEDLIRFLQERNMPVPVELQGKPVRVVVVDDEPDMAKLIGRAVKGEHPDYEVFEAHDGFRAGTVVATIKPDVVVLDLRMPGMDGFEVCRQIKTQDETKHVAVIAVTAYPSEEAEAEILKCGARICLHKPVDLANLVSNIEDAVKAERG